MAYRDAWKLQEQLHEQVLTGGEEHLLLVEHPPVITLGRRPGLAKNILGSADALQRSGGQLQDDLVVLVLRRPSADRSQRTDVG